MKKNELATFITYIGMIAIVLITGLTKIKPALAIYAKDGKIPGILLLAISIAVGIVLNAFLLEQGHYVGARAGGYKVISFNVLGFCSELDQNGKKHRGIKKYNGLTGETKIVPTDLKRNSMTASIVFPLLAFLIEVMVCVVLIAIGKNKAYWLYILSTVVLACGGVIYLYNYFPGKLENETDGYRMTILNKQVNKEAYNDMLFAAYQLSVGKAPTYLRSYEEVTEFTASINLIKVYEKLKAKDFSGAILLLQRTIDTPNHLTSSTRNFATTLKLSIIILTTKKEDGKTFYKTIDDSVRLYIQELNNSVCVRTFTLIQGVLEGEFEDTKYGLDQCKKLLDKCPDYAKDEEKLLYSFGLERIMSLHPTWDLKEYIIK